MAKKIANKTYVMDEAGNEVALQRGDKVDFQSARCVYLAREVMQVGKDLIWVKYETIEGGRRVTKTDKFKPEELIFVYRPEKTN